jgi:hypothetical protein
MYCPACGAPNEENATFCGSCGASLNGEAQLPRSGVDATQDTLAEVTAAVEEGKQATAGEVAGIEAFQEGIRQPAPDDSRTVVPPAEVVPAVPTPEMAPGTQVGPTGRQVHSRIYAVASAVVPTSGLAIASLILGIGGLTFLPLLGSIVGVILGYMARAEIRRRPGEVTGDGLALIGLILGWIGIGLAVLAFLLFGSIAVCALCGAFGASGPGN